MASAGARHGIPVGAAWCDAARLAGDLGNRICIYLTVAPCVTGAAMVQWMELHPVEHYAQAGEDGSESSARLRVERGLCLFRNESLPWR